MQTRSRSLVLLAALVSLAGFVRPAAATPVQYDLASGQVMLKGYLGGTRVMKPSSLKLTGTQITLDTASMRLVSVDFAGSGPLGLPMPSGHGGITDVVVDAVSVSASNGWLVQHSPSLYSFIAPSTTTLTVRPQGSGGSGTPLTVTRSGFINGAMVVDPATGQLVMQGIQLGKWGSVGGMAST